MQSHEDVYQRADDSSGFLGDIYQSNVEVWLTAAKQLRLAQQTSKKSTKVVNWPDEVLTRFNNNDYAIWDTLLEKSAILLTADELETLAAHFENTAHDALGNSSENDRYGLTALHAQIGLAGVGQALNKPEYIEKGTLLGSPEPNELQKLDLAKVLLNLGHAQRALTWLQGSWPKRFEWNLNRLLDECYQASGDLGAQLELRRQQYQQQPDIYNLNALLEISSAEESQTLRYQAIDKAEKIEHFSIRIDTLIELQASEVAASQVINNAKQLESVGYFVSPEWAQYFVKQSQPLAASLCYRSLIDDILAAARSKAYHYAAAYLKKLTLLQAKITDYQNHISHSEYFERLKTQHKRKSAFWSKVNS
ncbi:DUF6880 family protein [Gayadomonas joobiniege]|uniref:DUF6880 family protein n=1 Tax=Gayadomonas joobiniege TaxID=1234606 RepID=UPI00037CC36E|nr:DUF6880 family protein [Gayadomonas joobiniege]